jgi:hypothetical protein
MIHEILLVLALSLVVVFVRKQKLKNLIAVNIKGLAIFAASFFLQFLAILITTYFTDFFLSGYIHEYFSFIHCISYQLLLIGMVLNIEKHYMRILFLGTLLNFLVIMLNGMKMPVYIPMGYENAIENIQYLQSGKDLIHTAMTEDTVLRILGDIIVLSHPYPFPKTISIGDI